MQIKPIVLDIGSGTTKAGFAGEHTPIVEIPSLVGHLKNLASAATPRTGHHYIGNDAQTNRGILALRRPYEYGRVENWDDLEKLLHHTLAKELNISSENHAVFTSESLRTSPQDRQKMAEIMFESLNVPAFYSEVDAVLALYATGRTTGLVVQSGEQSTNVVAINKGRCIPGSGANFAIGGEGITELLRKLLSEKEICSLDMETVKDTKEKVCRVPRTGSCEEIIEASRRENAVCYTLPDGQTIQIGVPRLMAPDSMFITSNIGLDIGGIHCVALNEIERCDPYLKVDLYRNIVLAGGNTLLPGLADRIQHELESRSLHKNLTVNVVARPERKYLSWIGGSTVTCLPEFESRWVMKAEYEEFGPGGFGWDIHTAGEL